jgi:hypothetical protein
LLEQGRQSSVSCVFAATEGSGRSVDVALDGDGKAVEEMRANGAGLNGLD